MHQQFYDLVQSFLQAGEIECPSKSDEPVIRVEIGEYTFYMALLEKSKSIILQGVVGVIDGNKEEYQMLLQMNNLFSQTNGDTLGLDDGVVTLQCRIDIEGIETEKFIEKGCLFLENLFQMLNYFSDIQKFQEDVAKMCLTNEDEHLLLNTQNMLKI